jgi:hypothetical protein
MAAKRCINDFSPPSSANVRTGPEMNIGDGGFELKPALIFNTSWRFAAHSLSEE